MTASFLDRIRAKDPIDESRLTWLGRSNGWHYAKLGHKEFAVAPHPVEEGSHSRLKDGERYILRHGAVVLPDGASMATTAMHVAMEVEPGSWQKIAGKARKPTAEKKMRGWDRLAALPIMQRREPLRMATGPATRELPALPGPLTKDQEAAMEAVAAKAIKRGSSFISVGGNTPPDGSVADMIAWLAQRWGIELSLARGRLQARSEKPIRADVEALLDGARELIVGHLQGKPVMCSECAKQAVTIAAVDAPVCRDHAQ